MDSQYNEPRFYDYNGSTNWRAGVEYENLIIVTRNGNCYTSKKPVPSNIGEPENNPEYWLLTCSYNEQVEAYRQLSLALASRVEEATGDVSQDIAEEASAREQADNALRHQIEGVASDLADETSAREQADVVLSDKIDELIALSFISSRTGNVWKRKVWKTETNNTPDCPALDSYGDGVAIPFTDEVAGNDPYMDNYVVFKWQYCNYERESDGTARLTALEGYPDYKEEGSVDVGCIHPTFWWNWEEQSDHWILYFSDSPNAELGLVPWKDAVKEDGTVMPYFIVSAFPSVTASDGKLRSQPGRPANNASYNNINTAYATKGAGYHGSGSSINTLALIYLMVKYQTKLEATVFAGNISFAINAPIACAESNVKRVLVAATESRFQKGSGVTVGTADNAYWLNGSLVSWAEIESVEDVTIDGTQYRALNLKVSSAFTTTTEMFVVGSACPSGQTRKVMGHYDGSIISNTDSKHSFRIEGMEMMNGLWFVQADTVIEFLNNSWNVYVAPKGVAHPQNAHTGFKLIGQSSAFTGDSYVGNVDFDLQTGGYYHKEKASGSGVGNGAYHWNGGTSVADGTLREWRGWGSLTDGSNDSLVAGNGGHGLVAAFTAHGSRD